MSHNQQKTEQINDDNETCSQANEKIEGSDNVKSEEKNNNDAVSVANKDEPLEEVEKVRTYLARKNSVSQIHPAQEVTASEFTTTNNTNELVLIEETMTMNTAVVDDVAQHINENSEYNMTTDTREDFHTSKDFESILNNTETAAKSLHDTNMTMVTREVLPVELSESDSLEDYMVQFQASSSMLNKETPTLVEEKSKLELTYEEPTPNVITNSVDTEINPHYKEDVTEITITVKEASKSKKVSKSRYDSNLSAVLYLKERKSKSVAKGALKKAEIFPLATSTTIVGERESTNVPTFSNEYFNTSLQKSETRWFVYPISSKKSSQEDQKRVSTVISSPVQTAYNVSKKETLIKPINSSTPFSASPTTAFSARHYANQFRTKSLRSYEAADEDFFTEPCNNYNIKNVFDERPIKIIKHLGVSAADPDEYKRLYANDLVSSQELPLFITKIQPPKGISLAADSRQKKFYELDETSDIMALKLVDLEKEGLSEYKDYLLAKGIHHMNY